MKTADEIALTALRAEASPAPRPFVRVHTKPLGGDDAPLVLTNAIDLGPAPSTKNASANSISPTKQDLVVSLPGSVLAESSKTPVASPLGQGLDNVHAPDPALASTPSKAEILAKVRSAASTSTPRSRDVRQSEILGEVWVGAYEDVSGTYYPAHYVFIQLQPPKWLVPRAASSQVNFE